MLPVAKHTPSAMRAGQRAWHTTRRCRGEDARCVRMPSMVRRWKSVHSPINSSPPPRQVQSPVFDAPRGHHPLRSRLDCRLALTRPAANRRVGELGRCPAGKGDGGGQIGDVVVGALDEEKVDAVSSERVRGTGEPELGRLGRWRRRQCVSGGRPAQRECGCVLETLQEPAPRAHGALVSDGSAGARSCSKTTCGVLFAGLMCS